MRPINVLSLFDGKYEVDELGRIFSNARTRKVEMVGKISKCGYRVVLLTVDGKRYYKLVHRIVAEAFLPKIIGKNLVNYKNGVKTDNRLENLEWVTASENLIHARDSGMLPTTKINMRIANAIREEVGAHEEIAKKYNLKKSIIGQIKQNQRWKI